MRAQARLVALVHVRHDQIRRHHVADRRRLRIPPGGDDAREHVALGEDAGEASAVDDRQRADLVLRHEARGGQRPTRRSLDGHRLAIRRGST